MEIDNTIIGGSSPELLERDQRSARAAAKVAASERVETDARRAYFLSNPNASDDTWAKEKEAILTGIRADNASKALKDAEQSQRVVYQNF